MARILFPGLSPVSIEDFDSIKLLPCKELNTFVAVIYPSDAFNNPKDSYDAYEGKDTFTSFVRQTTLQSHWLLRDDEDIVDPVILVKNSPFGIGSDGKVSVGYGDTPSSAMRHAVELWQDALINIEKARLNRVFDAPSSPWGN